MASSLLEHTRGYHEEVERLERLIVADYKEEQRGFKERLLQGHRVKLMLDGIQQASAKLVSIYKDEDGARKEDIASLHGDEPFKSFYTRYRELISYHRRFPSIELTPAESDRALRVEPKVDFSGEEVGGRYLDLHEHYRRFINLKVGRKLEYPEYVSLFAHFDDIPRHKRNSKAYRDYLPKPAGLLDGLLQPATQPLSPLDKVFAAAGLRPAVGGRHVPRWEQQGALPPPDASAVLDLAAFDSVDELMELEPARIKDALGALGLKTGEPPGACRSPLAD
eukprot:jgi/Botrbrau1/6032/Bobra.0042s0017.1